MKILLQKIRRFSRLHIPAYSTDFAVKAFNIKRVKHAQNQQRFLECDDDNLVGYMSNTTTIDTWILWVYLH